MESIAEQGFHSDSMVALFTMATVWKVEYDLPHTTAGFSFSQLLAISSRVEGWWYLPVYFSTSIVLV